MPPLEPVPHCAKVTVSGTIGTSNWANVFHVVYSQDFMDLGQLNALATQFRAKYVTRFGPCISTGVNILTCTAQDIGSTTGGISSATGTTAGSASGPPSAANVSIVVSWKAPLHYRGGHGRTYLPGPPYAYQLDPQTWTSTLVTNALNGGNGLIADVAAITSIGPSPLYLALVHRVQRGIVLTPPSTEGIVSAVVDNRIDSARRRLGRDRTA